MSYGLLNCHSEHSLNQSVSHINEIVLKSKQIGATHVALTDINTMSGSIQFIETCDVNGVTPIVALELSIRDDNYTYNLVLYAKNYTGYQNLCLIITEANKKLIDNEEKNPYLTYSELEKLLDVNNVIVSSGNRKGIIGNLLSSNIILSKKISELKDELNQFDSPEDPAYQKNKDIIESNEQIIKLLSAKKTELSKITSKKFNHRKKGIEAFKGTDRYEEELNKLADEMEQNSLAQIELDDITKELASLKRTNTIVKKKTKQMEVNHEKYNAILEQISNLQKNIHTDNELYMICNNIISKYKKLLKQNFYIQVCADGSNNNFIKQSIQIATTTDTDYYITCVSFITNQGEEKEVQFMRSLKDKEWVQMDDEDIYIMSSSEIKNIVKDYLTEKEIHAALQTNSDICDKINFEMPEKKHYPKYRDANGFVIEDSAQEIRKCVEKGIIKRGYSDLPDIYKQRIEYELNVIITMGFSDYLLIVADFIQYAKNYIKTHTKSRIGYAVGPGRGSAAGCLVCYFLGITNFDPIVYNLKFERFLNIERVSMPDIDIDFSEEIRPIVIDYVKNKYGKSSVSLIRTALTQQGKATIRNSARLQGIKSCNQKQRYYDIADKLCNSLEEGKLISECEKELLEPFKSHADYSNIQEIVYNAKETEGMITTLGVHPAGVIIGDGNPLHTYCPLLYNKELKQWVVQCDKEEAERIGLLKMDFLIVKNLDKLTETIRRIKKYTGITVDLDNIPFEKEVFEEIYSKGKTMSVFQFESAGMRKMLQEFKPECFEDIILLIAAYRPGPMESIPDIIAVKNGKKKPYYCIPELESILKQTYGYPIYQEQLMDIFSKCAGFSQGEADIIRRYMSKKKVNEFIAYKEPFINGIMEHGASKTDATNLWDSLVDFSKYAFNKSHACAYALVSYMTAYLKYYYGQYYMCSVLNHSKQEKYGSLLYECKSMHIPIYLPSVNESQANFENTSNGILYGLEKIKGFKSASVEKIIGERNLFGRSNSFKNFIITTSCSEKEIKTLIEAGAFDVFTECNREQKTQSLLELLSLKEQLKKIENKLADKEVDKKNNQEYLAILHEIEKYSYMSIEENTNSLEVEKSLLGAYISSHPLSSYSDCYKKSIITKIIDIENGEHVILGMIKDLVRTKRKKDGKDMAFFEIEDITDHVHACCFVTEYQKYKEYIQEGNILLFSGKCEIKNDEISKEFIISKIEVCKPKKEPIFVSIQSKRDEAMAYYALKPFETDGEHDVLLHYQDTGYIEKKKMSVNKKALSLNGASIFLKILSKK